MLARLSRLLRLGLLTAGVGLAVVAGSAPATAQEDEKTFRLSSLNTTAIVNADGSMDVTEEITYQFAGGTFSNGYRSFDDAWRNRITDFAVTENGVPLETFTPETGKRGEWQWTFPATSGAHTYVITYGVPGAVEIGSDVGRLYWQFVGDDHPGIGDMTVDIKLPGEFGVAKPSTPDTDTSVVRAWAHGPRNGTVQPDSRRVQLRVAAVPARTFVEADVVIPVKGFTNPGTRELLPQILKEERNWLEPGMAAAQRAKWLAPLLSVLGLGAFGAVFRKWGKEPAKPEYIGDYWREPLEDSPAVAAATVGFGGIDGKAMAATIVDLAQRGYLTIEELESKGILNRTADYRFTATHPKPRTGHPLPAPVSPIEADLLGNLFRGRAVTTSEEFRDWARKNQTTSAAFWNGWKAKVAGEVNNRGYLEKQGCVAFSLPALIVGLLGLAAFVLVKQTRSNAGTYTFWGLICAATAVVIFAMFPLMRKRTVLGTEKAAKAKALKKYLEDFSNMNEAPVGSLILWERFLVYAVALGCAEKVYDGLKVKLPEMVNSGGFAPWWIPGPYGDLGRGLDRFPADFGEAAQTSMTPQNTSSGSGGGFSGGGGGGGGGGGFGAD